jgi:hypothetical protein
MSHISLYADINKYIISTNNRVNLLEQSRVQFGTQKSGPEPAVFAGLQESAVADLKGELEALWFPMREI